MLKEEASPSSSVHVLVASVSMRRSRSAERLYVAPASFSSIDHVSSGGP